MSEKWTKGPSGAVVGPEGEEIAKVWLNEDRDLIAAAPLMAEALEAAEEYEDFVDAGGQGESSTHFANEVDRLYRRAQDLRRRALSDARGER